MTKTVSMPAGRMVGVTREAMGPGALRRCTCMSAAAGRVYESLSAIVVVWWGWWWSGIFWVLFVADLRREWEWIWRCRLWW